MSYKQYTTKFNQPQDFYMMSEDGKRIVNVNEGLIDEKNGENLLNIDTNPNTSPNTSANIRVRFIPPPPPSPESSPNTSPSNASQSNISPLSQVSNFDEFKRTLDTKAILSNLVSGLSKLTRGSPNVFMGATTSNSTSSLTNMVDLESGLDTIEEEQNNVLGIVKLYQDASVPKRGSDGAAGYDLYSYEDATVPGWGKYIISTGISVRIPRNMYGRVASRSGLSVKNNLETGAGVIDCDYRGEVRVVLRNHSAVEYSIKKGDRIAQLILEYFSALPTKVFTEEEYDKFHGDSKRGAGGFGSTGK